jgi:hypothetical protein
VSKPAPNTNFFRDFKSLEGRVRTLERATRLNNSSIDTGAIKIVAADGTVLSVVGINGDYHGVTTLDGAGNIIAAIANDLTPPNQPSVPTVGPIPGGFYVTWDGKDTSGALMPPDWIVTEVHVSTTAGFTPSVETIYTTFTNAAGGSRNLLIGDTLPRYVKLVAVDHGKNASAPSGEVPITPDAVLVDIGDALIDGAQIIDNSILGPKIVNSSITTEKLTVGSFGANIVPNGDFEDPSTAASTIPALWTPGVPTAGAGGTALYETIASNVASGTHSVKVSLSGTSSSYGYTSVAFPVQPTTLYYVAAQVRGDGVSGHNFILRAYFGNTATFAITDVGVTSTDVITYTNPTASFALQEGQFITGSAQKYVRLSVVNSNVGVGGPSTGPVWVDSVVCRPVVGTTELADLGVVNAKIANLAVTDAKMGSVAAGKIIAGTLSADIVVGARIKTADTGQRVELNALGLKAYNSSNALTVDIPTSGSPSFAGIVTATGGAFTGNVTISSGSLATSTNTHAKRIIIDQAGVHGYGWYKIRGYTDIVLTNGSATITSPSGGFSSADVGRTIVIYQNAVPTDPDNTALSGGNSQAVILTAGVPNANTATISLAAAVNRTNTIMAPWDAREMTKLAADGSFMSSSLTTATGGKYIALGVDSAAGDNQTFSFMGNVHSGNAMVSNPSIYINTDGLSPASDVLCIWHGSQFSSVGFNGLAFHPSSGTQVLDEFSLWDAGTHPGRLWTRPGAFSLLTDQGIAITHVYHAVYTGVTIPGSPTAISGFVAQTVSYPYLFAHSPSVTCSVGTVNSSPFPVTNQSVANMTSTGCTVEVQQSWSTVSSSFTGAVISVIAMCS